jgi:hypothetical protein
MKPEKNPNRWNCSVLKLTCPKHERRGRQQIETNENYLIYFIFIFAEKQVRFIFLGKIGKLCGTNFNESF